ncbi:alpha-1,3-mannosyl-glycoprotein 2-beta-N-acetylglucosaminyltransferase-like [Salvelinus fontinalis]|uniref:alpha-1,3-mannosyl-glycoprotein 2-beta-N-acetylglucosaminyltransferase-like n=1 Tax=Salvelinus fontinalis TaxID=8038 RepID=UPI002486B7B6|nr:alpha-1,3-mannosyl-glycoprotein 2-beta-N-acetylglucosaminyltransferase-like [Salvelinus fontinalis]
MLRKRGSAILCGAFLFVAWNAIVVLYLWGRPLSGREEREMDGGRGGADLAGDLIHMAEAFEAELEMQRKILLQIQGHRSLWEQPNENGASRISPPQVVIPILVIACNRVTVKRCLDKLLEYRPSAELYPIIVSQDCGHAETAQVIGSYGSQVTHLKQPDLSDIAVRPEHKKFQGYYKISRHYRWALNQVFNSLSHSSVVIVEDDLEVAPDFFEYFRSLHPILKSDLSLWCVSAWNDNGRDGYVDPGKADLLYRTDFFPGLGWMMLKELWVELEPKWPGAFWDDWMRQPDQRRDRACIRPEISRTLTFGRKGVSLGQFYDKYLRYIKLNSEFVPFTKLDLAYLKEDKYKEIFEKQVYSAPLVKYEEVQQGQLKGAGPFCLHYSSKDGFKVLAKNLGVMEDLKSGVPRTGYRGVVSFLSRGRRIFLAPPPGWSKYDPTWS